MINAGIIACVCAVTVYFLLPSDVLKGSVNTRSQDSGFVSSSPYSCLNQCNPELGNNQTHLCETGLCSHNVSIPPVFSPHMICVQGGEGVADPNAVDTGCQIIPIPTNQGYNWSIVVKNGSLCKAICYNMSALRMGDMPLIHPIVDKFKINSNSGRDGKYHPIANKSGEELCSLSSTNVDPIDDSTKRSNVSGNCDLKYVQSPLTKVMVPAIRATASPEASAKVSCEAVCIRQQGMRFRNMTVFARDGELVTFENCHFCSLYYWKAILPAPDARDVLPQCYLTRNENNFWILQKSGGDNVDCSAQCLCHESPIDPH